MSTEGTSAFNKILSLLSSETLPTKRDTIANKILQSGETVAKMLTKMKKANLVQESNGFWSLTPAGKELYTTNPNASAATHLNGEAETSRVFWAESLEAFWRDSAMCSTAANNKVDGWDKALQVMSKQLDICMCLWLIKEGKTPAIAWHKECPEPNQEDHDVMAFIQNVVNQKDYKENT